MLVCSQSRFAIKLLVQHALPLVGLGASSGLRKYVASLADCISRIGLEV